jgi:hypothetical protein
MGSKLGIAIADIAPYFSLYWASLIIVVGHEQLKLLLII